MNIKRPLMPGFLKKFDQKLLLNKPGIWSARTHLVIYYSILFVLFLAALCFLEQTDVRDYSTTAYWIGFVSIISVIALTVWLIFLLRFNVFKKYGNIRPLHALVTFILYFIATGAIVLFSYVHPVVESVRANMAYGDEEIVQDMNAINKKICQLEYPLLQGRWKYDTVANAKVLHPAEPRGPQYEGDYEVIDNATYGKGLVPFYRLDSTSFYKRLNATDSLIKINDTLYLMYHTPAFNFFYNYNADEDTREKLLTAFELFHKVYGHPPAPGEREQISKELDILLHKYLYPQNPAYYGGLEITANDGPFDVIHKKYRLGNIDNSISHLIEKKYRWETSNLPDYVRLFYYFTLGISLLIFIFRHSTIRTFFLTLLTGVLLIIFTALMISFSHHEETASFMWTVIYTVLFFVGSLTTWWNQKRKAITGILINLFVFIIPVFPVLLFGWYYAWKTKQYNNQEPGLQRLEPLDLNQYFIYAETGGAVLFLVLLATYIGKVYRRWYSLPED